MNPQYARVSFSADSRKRAFSVAKLNRLAIRLASLACTAVLTCIPVWAQSITVVSPKGSTETNPLPSTGGARLQLKFTVSDAAFSKVRIVAFSGVAAKDGDFDVKGTGEQKVILNLLKGTNKIRLFGYSGTAANISETSSPQASLFITCNDDECGGSKDLIVKEDGGGGGSGGGAGGADKPEGNITIKIQKPKVDNGPLDALITAKGGATKLRAAVYDVNGKNIDTHDVELRALDNTLNVGFTTLKLTSEKNIIRVFDPAKLGDKANEAVAVVECGGTAEKCEALPAGDTTSTELITVDLPKSGVTVDSSFRDVYLTIKKLKDGKEIKKIKYLVIQKGKTVVNADDAPEVPVTYDGDEAKVMVPIKFAEGENLVTFFDVDHPLDDARRTNFTITCEGSKCADDFLVATVPSNSINTRVIVGMEQVGASSAESETKPFLDFFFTNALLFNTLKDKDGDDILGPDDKPIRVPRFGTWGLIRFSTTPQQTASFAVFPSNFVNQITDPEKVVDLVQSFDFVAGLEARLFSANGWNWTLIPGIRQHTRLFVTGGWGAISPLNPRRTSAQIFKIPGANSPQREEFVRRFGEPPGNKTYVGFVPLERDRFFRQYYFGVRLKSHFCDNDECNRFKNSFPSILDIGFGQNEAVTGGTFRPDGKRAWVFRLDAFYPFPFRPASFLYLYGNVLANLGRGGPNITVPLFLDQAPGEVQITSTDVFIPPADQQPSKLNRDYYKIGIGVNLTDLFNRNKTPPQ